MDSVNWLHCLCVFYDPRQMYSLIWIIGLNKMISNIDLFALIYAAISHDMDHPGYNNAYQVGGAVSIAVWYLVTLFAGHHCL